MCNSWVRSLTTFPTDTIQIRTCISISWNYTRKRRVNAKWKKEKLSAFRQGDKYCNFCCIKFWISTIRDNRVKRKLLKRTYSLLEYELYRTLQFWKCSSVPSFEQVLIKVTDAFAICIRLLKLPTKFRVFNSPESERYLLTGQMSHDTCR